MARASDEVRRLLEQEIQSGVLAPGDTIDERTLSERFDVSRTPAREAILQLAASGLVTLRPRRGAVVTGLDVEEAIAMMETLVAIESEAARLAARRMSAAETAELAKIYEEGEEAARSSDSAAYIETNARFHRAIYRGARNSYLAELIKNTRRRMAFYHKSSLTQKARIERSYDEHAAVLAAITAGDPDAASDAMRDHILSGGQVYADIVATLSRSSAKGADESS